MLFIVQLVDYVMFHEQADEDVRETPVNRQHYHALVRIFGDMIGADNLKLLLVELKNTLAVLIPCRHIAQVL